jgi:hypothetical protein
VNKEQVSQRRLRDKVSEMRTWNGFNEYYALTLTASTDGGAQWSVHSHYAGPSERYPGWERRAASIVDPQAMTHLWDGIGESWVAVDDRVALALWIRLGGHALVEVSLAQEWLPRWVATREVAPNGPTGFLFGDSLGERQRKHRPPRAVRKRIFERDDHTCQRCRRTSEEVTLTRHHVLAHQHGGLTQENNLITLCDDCHREVHSDRSWYPASDLQGILLAHEIDGFAEDHNASVQRHRRLVARLLA